MFNYRTSRYSRWIFRNRLLTLLGVICIFLLMNRYFCGYDYGVVFLRMKHAIDHSTNFNRSSSEIVQVTQRRAIIVYYPHSEEKTYFPELRWFYRSWIEIMLLSEPKAWRTDLLIFTFKMTSNLKRLACLLEQVRRNNDEPPQCRVFLYQPVSTRHSPINLTRPIDVQRSKLLYQHLQKYGYIDSINILVEGYSVFAQYDSILRTDLDVFLTKYFGSYVPISNNTLLVGLGGYSTEFNSNRLRRIAKDIGWLYANLTGIGSTW